MPLQNRVSPFGDIVATPARGALMGNRGCLHDQNRQVIRKSQRPLWITCELAFKGRRRELMTPGSYTELFFLDETTAYAAGHRPCGECRREAYQAFKAAWAKAHPESDQSISAIDRALHAARINRDGTKKTWSAPLGTLPSGTMIEHEGKALLLWGGQQWVWSFEGYQPFSGPISAESSVTVLTPEPIVRVFEAGLNKGLRVTINQLSLPAKQDGKGQRQP